MGIDDMVMNKQSRVKEILQTLEVDASAQYNALKNRDDIDWDCYDKNNWLNTVELIKELAGQLGVTIVDNIEVEEVHLCDQCGEEQCVCCEECEDEDCDCEKEIVDSE